MKINEFPIDELVKMACDNQMITEDEYYGESQNRNCATARQMVCFILREKGFNNQKISDLTGFTIPRILNSIHSLNHKSAKVNYKLEQLKRKFNEIYFTA